MAATSGQSDAELLCLECATDRKLRVFIPCASHPNREPNLEQASQPFPNTFLYSSPLSGRNIRLLQLYPGRGDSILQCRLIVEPLDQGVAYHALSYTWGDPRITQTILCDGKRLDITQSLHSALWQLREEGNGAAVWADAVCINQSDVQEKTAQVRMMRDIYQQTSLVVVWLGRAHQTDEQGFAMMRRIYGLIQVPTLEETRLPVDFSPLEKLGLPGYYAPEWVAFCSILYRPYFSRVWIVQEIVVAKWCIVRCGSIAVERDVLLGVGAIVERFYCLKYVVMLHAVPETGSTMAAYYSARDLWLIQSSLDRGERLTILRFLSSTRMFKASDDRDRVFALVGLASDVNSDSIDYGKNLNEILIQVAKTCLLDEYSWGATMLSWVDSTRHSDNLPSWVPDWIRNPQQVPLASTFSPMRPVLGLQPNWRFSSHDSLQLEGLIFDRLCSIVDDTPYLKPLHLVKEEGALQEHSREMEAWRSRCWELAQSLDPYPTGEDPFEAYWRTLIFNTSHKGSAAPPEYEHSYRSWISIANAYSNVIAMAAAPRPPFRAPLSRASALALLNLALALVYAHSPPRSAGGWTKALLFCAAINWCLLRAFNVLPNAGLIIKSLKVLWLIMRHRKAAEHFDEAFKAFIGGRKVCITHGGYLGWVPLAALSDDRVCIFRGASCRSSFGRTGWVGGCWVIATYTA